MYQSSTEYGRLIQQPSRTFKAKIVVDGKITISTGIKSLKIVGGSNSGDIFLIGSCISQYVELEIATTLQLENRVLEVFIGQRVGSADEWISSGIFIAAKPEKDEEVIKVAAYDRMILTDRAYFSNLPSTTTTTAILNEIATFLKIPVITSGLNDYTMKKPVGYTCREVLSYIAQMYGGFAICNRKGQIGIKKYSAVDYAVNTDRYWDTFAHNDFEYRIGKITCFTGKDKEGSSVSISAGGKGREMVISNPFMTQERLTAVYNGLKDFGYMPGSLRMFGDNRLDPWDVVTVVDRKGSTYKAPLMKLVQDFDGGLTTEIEAAGETEAESEQGFKGPLAQAIDRYAIKLALIDHAIINKLDVEFANITFAKIKELEAVQAKITKLEVEELTAIKASIQTANINLANINNLLAGNAGVGDLTSIKITAQNATIESALIKEIVSASMTVNDLLAGKISTTKFQIGSDNGGLLMFGSTIQSKDKNNVTRMQFGQDAAGGYNIYIADASGKQMWNALGLTGDAIKSPIIVDGMVADNANINAGKIDKQTLETVINGGNVSIKSSVVKLDTTGQTLDMAFKQVHDEINGIISEDGTYILQTFVEGGHVGDSRTATIHAKVYVKNADATETIPSNRFLWTRNSEYTDEDAVWNSQQITGYSLTLTGDDVDMVASFQCAVTIPEEYSIETRDNYVITDTAGNEILALFM